MVAFLRICGVFEKAVHVWRGVSLCRSKLSNTAFVNALTLFMGALHSFVCTCDVLDPLNLSTMLSSTFRMALIATSFVVGQLRSDASVFSAVNVLQLNVLPVHNSRK